MNAKPSGCEGCPINEKSKGFVYGQNPPGSEVLLVQYKPNTQSAKAGVAGMTSEANVLKTQVIPREVGVRANRVAFDHVIRCSPKPGCTAKELKGATRHCRQYDSIQDSVEVVVATSDLAWKELSDGAGTCSDWRGFYSQRTDMTDIGLTDHHDHFLNTKKPVFRVFSWSEQSKPVWRKFATKNDWRKVGRFYRGDWPIKPPRYTEIKSNFDFDEFVKAFSGDTVYIDTEVFYEKDVQQAVGMLNSGKFSHLNRADLKSKIVNPTTEYLDGVIHMIGIGDDSKVWVWDLKDEDCLSLSKITELVRYLVQNKRTVYHNSLYDTHRFLENYGIDITEHKELEDSMLAMGILWSEMPKSLDFCNSLFGSLNKRKHLGTWSKDYLLGDIVATRDVWKDLESQFKRDPLSESIYRDIQMPLVPAVFRRHVLGIHVDHVELERCAAGVEKRREAAIKLGNEYVGKFGLEGINLGSPKQVSEFIRTDKSILIPSEIKPKAGGGLSTDKDSLAILQEAHLPLRTDEEETLEVRVERGGHPFIEAKVQYNQVNTIYSTYIQKMRPHEKVYPRFRLSSQATGRGSSTGPCLEGTPRWMGGIFKPAPGKAWVSGDFANIELRFFAYRAPDQTLIDGFEKGWDLHSQATCDAFKWSSPEDRLEYANLTEFLTDPAEICQHYKWQMDEDDTEGAGFGWTWKAWKSKTPANHGDDICDKCWASWAVLGGPPPDWKADDDDRRRWAKALEFRSIYGGKPDNAHTIPGSRSMGMSKQELIGAGHAWRNAHPAIDQYEEEIRDEVEATRIVRSPLGRPRRLLDDNTDRALRQAANHPIQSFVADATNLTLVKVLERAPWATFVYTKHDSICLECDADRVDELSEILQTEAEAPRLVSNDRYIKFPFDMSKPKYGDVITEKE